MVHIRTITILWLSCLSLLSQPFTQSELGWQWQYKRTHGGGVIIDPTNGCGITLEAETVAYLQCVTTNASNSFLPIDWPRSWGVTNCNYWACGGSNQMINIPQTIDAVVKTLKSDGLWAKMDAMYLFPFCYTVFGRTNSLIMNSVNLVNPSPSNLRLTWSVCVGDTNFIGDGFSSFPTAACTENGAYGSTTWGRVATYNYGAGAWIVDTPMDHGYQDEVLSEIGIDNGSFISEASSHWIAANGFEVQAANVYGEYAFSGPPKWKGFHHLSTFANTNAGTLAWTFWENGTTLSTNGAYGGVGLNTVEIHAPAYYATDSTTYTNAVSGRLGAAFLTQQLTEVEQLQLNGDMITIMHGFRRN